MPVLRTACSRDCPDACSIDVHTDEHGRAVKLKGAADDPVTRGFLCERTSRFLTRQYSPDRITRPLWRPSRDQELRPISWTDALDLAADRLAGIRDLHGPAAILHYRSGGAMGMIKRLSDNLFGMFGPVTTKSGDICSGAGEAAQEADFGISECHDLFDLKNSRHIVLWGKNVHTSGPHLLPVLMEAQRKGARLIGLDVNRTRLASLCHEFYQVRPGGDFDLALNVAARMRENGWIPAAAAGYCDNWDLFWEMVQRVPRDTSPVVEALARALHEGPCNVQIGWGLSRRRYGATAVRAIDALAAISGNLGIPGGGASFYFRRRSAFVCPDIPEGPTLPEARLGPSMLQAGIRAVWVTAGNPVAMLPESASVAEAFRKAEFVAVVETHPTDTTDMADLVLPTLTLLEDDDLLGAYGNHYLRVSEPALQPPGEARHELWIWQELARRWELPDKLEGTPSEWKERLLGGRVALSELRRGPVRNPLATPLLFENGRFPTPSGKMNLICQEPPRTGHDPAYPWTLLAISTPKAQSSQWSEIPDSPPRARLHPGNANGWTDGQLLKLQSRRGEMTVRLVLDPDVHPEVVCMDKGGQARLGGCPNALIEAVETDLGGGASFYDERVRLAEL